MDSSSYMYYIQTKRVVRFEKLIWLLAVVGIILLLIIYWG